MYRIVPLDKQWNELLLSIPGSTVFQRSEWVTSFQEVFFPGAKAYGVVLGSADSMLGIVPVIHGRRFGLRFAGSPPRHVLTPHMGVACRQQPAECLDAFATFCAEQKFHVVRTTFPTGVDPDMARRAGFSTVSFTTAHIDLTKGADSLWKEMDSKSRNQVRQGEKNNLQITAAESSADISDYLAVREALYRRQGMKVETSQRFVGQVLSRISPAQYKMFMVRHEGTLIAAVALLLHQDTCLYWDGVSAAEFNKLRPNNVLQWHAIQWAAGAGYRTYDLGGTNTPTIAHFKRGFGGTEVRYDELWRFSPTIVEHLWRWYTRARERSHAPSSDGRSKNE